MINRIIIAKVVDGMPGNWGLVGLIIISWLLGLAMIELMIRDKVIDVQHRIKYIVGYIRYAMIVFGGVALYGHCYVNG